MSDVQIIHGDCFDEMAKLQAESAHAFVTDPPYGIRFMGKAWDGKDISTKTEQRRVIASQDLGIDRMNREGRKQAGPNAGYRAESHEAGKYDRSHSANAKFQAWTEGWAREAFRLLKPGGHLVSFASTRTYHRMVCGIEDAGFEIRDQLAWVFGSGFPKSFNLVGEWEGWGTALKPAWEPIVLARKPLNGTVAANVAKHGTGALNVNGCRIGTTQIQTCGGSKGGTVAEFGFRPEIRGELHVGRWPANLAHDGSAEVLAQFPESDGQCGNLNGQSEGRKSQGIFGDMPAASEALARGDTGSAARFFYCAKASAAERDVGLDGYEVVYARCSAWENADQKARLLVDMDQSPPRVIGVSGAPNNDACEWSMMLFGSASSDRSLLGSKSTIKISTSLIATSEIFRYLLRSLTKESTADAHSSAGNGSSHAGNAETNSRRLIITSGLTVSVRGVERAASQTQWEISGIGGGVSAHDLVDRKPGSAGMNSPRAGAGRTSKGERKSNHPTVKPVELMRWLCRLVTPPNGRIIDPFLGSGTTGVAAVLEGFDFTGIEREADYVPIARARIAEAQGPLFATV